MIVKRQRHLLWVVTVLVAGGCDAGPAEPMAVSLSPAATAYLNDALDIMQFNSLTRDEFDWVAFRSTSMAEAEAAMAQSVADIHPMIIAALVRLGDNHSFFLGPGGQQAPPGERGGTESDRQLATEPMSQLLEAGVGYVDMPPFAGGGPEGNALAMSYHGLIEAVDTIAPMCRWVVDLRGNTGGNMWPMIAGVGPILGEGTLGSFVYPDSVVSPWFYENGQAGVDSFVVAAADNAYVLKSPSPRVAVLTDSLTASSGEAVAVAFRGRDSARSFGGGTWGVSTANAMFPLADGAVIFLTIATMADRTGQVYGEELIPHEAVAGVKTGDRATDAVLDAAVAWLLGQACT
jgi:carboxyl-terminal processing protease